MKPIPQPLVDLLNKCDSGQHVLMFTVPLRIIRIIATDDSFTKFRVEQLTITNKDPQNPHGTWTTLSMHAGEQPGAAWGIACEAACKAQIELRNKLMKKAQAHRPKLMVPA